jgi:hypothetical protein
MAHEMTEALLFFRHYRAGGEICLIRGQQGMVSQGAKAVLRVGALIELPSGDTFRVARDGSLKPL